MGPAVAAVVGLGVLAILAFNLNLKGRSPGSPETAGDGSLIQNEGQSQAAGVKPAGFREYPIGDEVDRNHMQIAAVWLPPVEMDGMAGTSPTDLIHLEADIHATEGNPNGFAKDEFVPYMKVSYAIRPADAAADSAPVLSGDLMPMVARDGLHYGANVAMPKAGAYTLSYHIEPPSAGGLGRHADAATGVDPWWEPFDVQFEWDYEGLPNSSQTVTATTP
jgi:uncharacterized protein involved in high-affinity Fe2+ transport